jgi:thiol-disulfide isomerase/thioredoxin
MKRLSIVLLLMLSIMLSACGKNADSVQPPNNEQAQQTQTQEEQNAESNKVKAPDFQLKNIKGENIKLSSLQGKVIVLNFFATWCPPCKAELPGFLKVVREYNGKDVEFVFVDIQEDKKTVESFLKEQNFTEIIPLLDITGEVSGLYAVRGIPATFIIDKEGNLVTSHEGFMDEAGLKTAIEEGMAQK